MSISPVKVLGVPFVVSTPSQAIALVIRHLKASEPPTSFRYANSWCLVLASDRPDYKNLLSNGGINFPDGAPVAALMRIIDRRARKVRGPSVFEGVLDLGRSDGVRHMFMGGTESSLASMVTEAKRKYPHVQIVGTYSPPFYSDLNDDIVADCAIAVEACRPDIVWIGIGSPKQDYLARELVDRTGVNSAGVGAAFDILAGVVRAAPRWMQALGLEWLFRLLSEPKRLARRYLVGNVKFVWLILTSEDRVRR